MKADGERHTVTGRIMTLTLNPESASDELLLTELFRALEPGHKGDIIVTHARDVPRQVFVWKPTGRNL